MVDAKTWTTVGASSEEHDMMPHKGFHYDIFIDQNGESVFLGNLNQTIGHGGEANVYQYRRDKVAKLFREYDPEREAKLKILLHLVDLDTAFCLPERLLYNKKGVVAGYIMPFRKGYVLGDSIFQPMEFKAKFPLWTRVELTMLALRCVEAIDNLHKHNILIGDMNASNIIVDAPGKVSFVDVDSYQIDDYMCKVGTCSAFTSPRLQGKNFRNEPRSLEDENFATSTLLFMIFMLGKSPYPNDGGNVGDNIRKMNFLFPLGNMTSSVQGLGNFWMKLWGFLPEEIRGAFHKTFKLGQPISLSEWKAILNQYYNDLKRNKYTRSIKY